MVSHFYKDGLVAARRMIWSLRGWFSCYKDDLVTTMMVWEVATKRVD